MRVPVTWLRSLCDPGLSTPALAERLAMTGTEVERVERVGVGSPDAFVVGRVLSAEPHPDADRLRVCSVDDGSGAPRTIVCGAPNVAAGQIVAVARPGAVMPDGQTLGEAELRGVVSSGMILAEDEVGLGPDHGGIMVLDDGLDPGAPLAGTLPIAEEVLELEITPNRPDCLGVYGVAREVHAVTGAALAEDPADAEAEPSGAGAAEDAISIAIEDPDICLRFTARVFEDVRIGPSPLWLKARLSAAGQRPISNVVDVTNYVMLLTGHPMHAFDLDRIRGGRLGVRRARDGELMTTLDAVERGLDSSMAVIEDAEGPSSVAGIIGGQVSEVSEKTTRVLMEAATWVGTNILMTSSRLGVRSEASTRFEKQLHPEQALGAQRLAARLMVEVCGARLAPGTIDVYPRPAEPRVVALRVERVAGLLGAEIPVEEVRAILTRLGFVVAPGRPAEGGADASPDTVAVLSVTIPPHRDADVQREADLIEEVARVHGLDSLPVTLPARRRAIGGLSPAQRLRRRLEDALRDRGLAEIVAWAFVSPSALRHLRVPEDAGPRLANPLSEDQSVMRPLLLPGLLDAAAHNAARENPRLALFESARVYPAEGLVLDAPAGSPGGVRPAAERHHLGALLTEAAAGGWRSTERPADFFAARALVEALLEVAGVSFDVAPGPGRSFLHPGRAAAVICEGREAGWIGEVHPQVVREWGLDGAVAAFELDIDAVTELAPGPAGYADVTSFPPVLQDIAVVVEEERSAAEVEAAVRAGGGELLRAVRIFDLYRGEQVGEGQKSLALRLEFRAPDRTLTDEEVAARRDAIAERLEAVGGRLRA
jgi:phenylalanyl-tRNA synthetase beta chain